MSSDFAELLALPLEEFQIRLKDGEYSDVQRLCKHLSLNAKGARPELESRLVEWKKNDAVPESPGAREDRRRSPKTGRAAAALRSAAPKDTNTGQQPEDNMEIDKEKCKEAMSVDQRLLSAAELQARGLAPRTGSSTDSVAAAISAAGLSFGGKQFSGHPAAWPMPPALPQSGVPTQMFIGTAPATPARPVAALAAGTPLDELRARAAAVRASLVESVPKAPAVPADLEGREAVLAAEAAGDFEPSNGDLMNTMTIMLQNMVARDDLRAAQAETIESTRVLMTEALAPVHERLESVNTSVGQALDETKTLHERLIVVESGQVSEFDRVGRLEAEVKAFKETDPRGASAPSKPDKNDVNFLRVSFKGFGAEEFVERHATIKAFMEQHFSGVSYACIDTRMRAPYGGKKATDESFVQFACVEARDRVADVIVAKKYYENVKSSKGAKLTVGKSKTERQRQRDFLMYKAEVLIKEKIQKRGASGDVKYTKSKDERKVTVNGVNAFVQLRTDARGNFCGDFADLVLPP